ncbi:transcriptional regulator [Acidipropionibacterium jensenii]|uniref:Transcriptional regulator n=1 Tax=Acidipropionibacterium jensenii TaxID=1749 RepID=A0A3Q9UKS0_9ACTN|nr:sugar-binding domain-containing protein [Acidipropionibacterium jensenii]AZZ40556.1 transcriptional regulator [Acidipropionibacterium jensenii]
MNEWADDLWTAASMYYMQGETMEVIAKHLGTSRSTVSRLLKQARETGLVRISLAQPTGARTGLGTSLSRMFGVRTTIVPVRSGTTEVHRLDQVARIAGQHITDLVHDGVSIGLAWGTTLDAITQHLIPKDVRNVRVVQMNGAANPGSFGIPYTGAIMTRMAQAFQGEVVHFPVPAFFDDPQTKVAMWRERAVQSVLAAQRSLDLAVFGLGALDAPVPSHVYSAGYLTEAEMSELTAYGVVGDVNTVFLKADGSFTDIPFNERATGMTPHQLQKVPRRVCVVAGRAKAKALLAALRARVATDLVVDDETARAVLDLM